VRAIDLHTHHEDMKSEENPEGLLQDFFMVFTLFMVALFTGH
jgi:hypothetical protein